jgi:branched-chain amino acid transport system substrate-binding protein
LANSAISTQAATALNFELSIGGNIVPALAAYKRFPGLEGATYYNFDILKNPINDWLVAEHQNRFNAPTAGGFEAGWRPSLRSKAKSSDTERAYRTMQGMELDTPKAR